MAKFRTPAIVLLLLMFVLSFSTGVIGEDDVFGGLPGVPSTSGSSQGGAAASTSTVGSDFVDQDSLRDFIALLRSLSHSASDPTANGDVDVGGEDEPAAFALGAGVQQPPAPIAVIHDGSVSYIVLQSQSNGEAEAPGKIDDNDDSSDGSNGDGRDSKKAPKGVPGIGSDTPDKGPDGDPPDPPDKKSKDNAKGGKKGNGKSEGSNWDPPDPPDKKSKDDAKGDKKGNGKGKKN